MRRSVIAGALASACGAPVVDRAPRAPTLRDRGAAPELVGLDGWLNSDPLTLAALRGSVVLLEFWSYSCVNCVRTIPHIRRWRDAFADRGLQVIGVHTPEFARERVRANVEAAAARLGVDYPVALDSDRATWRAFGMRAWPTLVLVNRGGRIVLRHEGEGEERAITRLIGTAVARM